MSVGLQAPGTDERTADRAPPGPPRTVVVPPNTPRTSADPYTANRETDARGALCRGLAEYIEDLVIEQEDGREVRLVRVFDDWADPEEVAEYPSAVVYTPTTGVYDARSLTKVPTKAQQIPAPDNRYVMVTADLSINLRLEVWCTDRMERASLVAALEDLLSPFVGSYGFTLQLPHYYNVRAAYEMVDVTYPDTETAVISRNRLAAITLSAQVPVIKLASFPDANISVRVADVGPNVVLTVE